MEPSHPEVTASVEEATTRLEARIQHWIQAGHNSIANCDPIANTGSAHNRYHLSTDPDLANINPGSDGTLTPSRISKGSSIHPSTRPSRTFYPYPALIP